MSFVRMLKVDLRRMFYSKKFYFSIIVIFFLVLISIWPEVQASEYTSSIYYLVNSRGGIGAFLLATSVAAVLPFGLSYWEDERNNYSYCIEVRSGNRVYSWAHITTTAISTFLVVVLGYCLCFGILSSKLPIITENEIRSLEYTLSNSGSLSIYDYIVYNGKYIAYFGAVFSIEAMGYAFMSVFTMMISAKVKNVFVLLSTPILLYYGSVFLGNVLHLPAMFYWYGIMKNGMIWDGKSANTVMNLIITIFYFAILIFLEGYIFIKCRKKGRNNG